MTQASGKHHLKRSAQGALALALLIGTTTAQAQEPRESLGYQEPMRKLRQPGEIRSLSGPKQGDPLAIAKGFIQEQSAALGLTAADLSDVVVHKQYVSKHNGITHIFMIQRFAGIEVHGANLTINVARDGSIINLGCTFVPGLKQAVQGTRPVLTALEALDFAARHVSVSFTEPVRVLEAVGGADSRTRLSSGGLEAADIPARLVLQPVGPGAVRLAWRIDIDDHAKGSHHWRATVDAQSGEVHSLSDFVDRDSYTVFPIPIENPDKAGGVRTMVANPADVVASPFGWHDTNGAAGAEFTITRGNNAHAYTDIDANNSPDAGSSPDGGGTLVFDPSLDLGMAPSTYRPAAVTNLFYWNNIVHDVFYQYGFDEAAGNFQVNNYGNGGLGNDDVQAEAQDGSNTNNANFGTPPDGSRPRMQMFVWTPANPDRDSDFDNLVIAHEYGHGISNRLTCDAAGLGNSEQMGEGWSDWLGLVITASAGDTANTGRGIANYLQNQSASGPGIRPAHYTTNFAVNGFTYLDIGFVSVPHGVGFVWASMLWEVYWKLVDAYGFDPNLYSGTAGNNLAIQLVMDGMKLQPCNPGFVDGRDAILDAEVALTSGDNQCLIWEGFAKRGLGIGANQADPDIAGDGAEDFNLPQYCTTFGAIQATQSVCAGQNAIYNVLIGSSLVGDVTLSATGHPAGSTASFNPNPVTTPRRSILTIGNTAGVTAGSYPITLTADDANNPPPDPNSTVTLVVVTPVGVPSLTSPASGTVDVPPTPLLQWTAAAQAASYVVEVDDNADFSSIEYTATVAGTSHGVTQGLALTTTYFWRVRATNLCGDGTDSTTFSFTTDADFCTAGLTPNALFQTDFEAGAAGWAQGSGGTQNTWALSNARPYSGTQAWYAEDFGTVSDQRLVSPAFVLPAGQNPLTLQFATYKHFETPNGDGRCWDAGILEVSTNNGVSWAKIEQANLLTDPYDNIIWNNTPGNNPITVNYGATQAWCPPAAEDYLISAVNLNSFAGQTVRFRFRLGSDGAAGAEGWYVDDVKVESCLGGPTSTPTITPTPTITMTSTLTQTFTSTPTFTPTDTPTATETPSLTATPTQTVAETATVTQTPTVTGTATQIPTSVASDSAPASAALLLLGIGVLLVLRPYARRRGAVN